MSKICSLFGAVATEVCTTATRTVVGGGDRDCCLHHESKLIDLLKLWTVEALSKGSKVKEAVLDLMTSTKPRTFSAYE